LGFLEAALNWETDQPRQPVISSTHLVQCDIYSPHDFLGARLNETPSPARTPLEVAVENNRLDVIMHPVIRRLISVKWRVFGKLGGIGALLLNLLYATLWTIMAVTIPTTKEDAYFPLPDKIWRWIIAVIIAILTIYEIVQQISGMLYCIVMWNTADSKKVPKL
jgi:hypothetical protein